MNRSAAILLTCVLVLGVIAQGQRRPTSRPAGGADSQAAKKEAAIKAYEQVAADYMAGKWDDLTKSLKALYPHNRFLVREQHNNVRYMRTQSKAFRPKWWRDTKSPSKVSFKARIWSRNLTANYAPSNSLGVQQAYYDPNTRRILVVVSWRPEMVDNPKAAGGELAKLHGLTKGDIGEMIVWHELGHNYITNFLPVKHVLSLYIDHKILFYHLQEFYADLTAIYHSSPKACRAAMMMRLDSMRENEEGEEHNRAAQAIGSFLLAHFLAEPDKWPSVHSPPEVPKEDIERNTILYFYSHFDPKWTVPEDRLLRKVIHAFIKKNGERTLKSRGKVLLPNKLSFILVSSRDREAQPKRDAWIADRLRAIIKEKRADKPVEKKKGDKPTPELRIEIPH